jgi:hypothetical protein
VVPLSSAPLSDALVPPSGLEGLAGLWPAMVRVEAVHGVQQRGATRCRWSVTNKMVALLGGPTEAPDGKDPGISVLISITSGSSRWISRWIVLGITLWIGTEISSLLGLWSRLNRRGAQLGRVVGVPCDSAFHVKRSPGFGCTSTVRCF